MLQQQIPAQFLHFKTSQVTTTATTQSTTETKHCSRTVHSASTVKLSSVSDNSYRPFHEPSSKSCSTSSMVQTTDMEYMCILGTKTSKEPMQMKIKHFLHAKTLTFAKQELLKYHLSLNYLNIFVTVLISYRTDVNLPRFRTNIVKKKYYTVIKTCIFHLFKFLQDHHNHIM